jgi:outer membrane protein TolC
MSVALLLAALASAAAAPQASTGTVSASSAAVVAASTSAPVRLADPGRAPVPLEFFVRAALTRGLDAMAAKADAERGDADGRAARGLFDPVLSAAASASESDERRVRVPGVVPAPVRTKAQDGSVSLTQTLPIGSIVDLTAVSSRDEVTPAAPLFASGLTLTLVQPLLRGAGLAAYASARAASFGGEAAVAAARRSLEQAIADVENAYWSLRRLEHDEDAAERSLRTAEELARRNRELSRLKLMSDHDVLVSDEGVEVRRAVYIAAVRARRDAADDLVFLSYGESVRQQLEDEGFGVRTDSGAASSLSVPSSGLPAYAAAVEQALARRGDVAAARKTLAQAEALYRAARSARLPQLDASGSIGRAGSDQTGLPGAQRDSFTGARRNRNPSWSAGLDFSIPLGNRPGYYGMRSAGAALARARADLAAVENNARLEVRKSLRAVRSEEERYAVAAKAAELARREFEQERARMRFGLVDSFRVLLAEEQAVQADLAFDVAENARAAAATAYRLAVGDIAAGREDALPRLP